MMRVGLADCSLAQLTLPCVVVMRHVLRPAREFKVRASPARSDLDLPLSTTAISVASAHHTLNTVADSYK
jgi:hypothetical protein